MSSAAATTLRARLTAPALGLLVALCFLPGTFGLALQWPDELRVAGIAAEMKSGGSLVIPTLGGRPFLEQPPLAYWGIAAALHVPCADDGVARLSSVAFALLGAVAAGLLAARVTGDPRAGGLAAGALLVTAEHARMGHRAMVDAPLAAGVAWTVYALWRAVDEPERRVWFPAAGAAAAVAFYSKGAIGLAFPALAFLGIVAARNAWSVWLRPWLWTAPATCVLLVLPWVVALHLEGGWDALRVVFVDNHLKRFVPDEDYLGGHHQPWYFYLRVAPLIFLPVTAVLPAAIAAAVLDRGRAARDLCGLLGGWLGLGLLFLSAAGTKRNNYLLPLAPAAAVLAGAWLASLGTRRLNWLDRATVAFLALGTVLAPIAPPVLAAVLGVQATVLPWVAALAALVGAVVAVSALRQGRLAAFVTAAGVVACVTSAAASGAIAESGGRARTAAAFSRAAGERLPPGARLVTVDGVEALRGALAFYAGRPSESLFLDDALDEVRGPRPAYFAVIQKVGRVPDPLDPAPIALLVSAGATSLLVDERDAGHGNRSVLALLANQAAIAAETSARGGSP